MNESSNGFELPDVLGGWGTLVIDPPWPFRDRGSRATPGYSMLDLPTIGALPVDKIAAPNAHLYLWTVDAHLGFALCLVAHWGFEFKHCLVWAKASEKTGKVQIGMGHWYRKAHELCLFAVRGRAPIADRSLPSVIVAPRGVHSAKPEQLQDYAERASPAPRLELFARRPRDGWTVWGNEV